ncbi:hypothetical protein AGLY_017389 [Aphis glycines]|uniref:Uncharacterized protein n=1 Tax=Aphis glycines TaxID=307491 RepID=A0A6G0SX22_APHGL|nr:hypothetical protein AGLY_017389 [Aphis glycines]
MQVSGLTTSLIVLNKKGVFIKVRPSLRTFKPSVRSYVLQYKNHNKNNLYIVIWPYRIVYKLKNKTKQLGIVKIFYYFNLENLVLAWRNQSATNFSNSESVQYCISIKNKLNLNHYNLLLLIEFIKPESPILVSIFLPLPVQENFIAYWFVMSFDKTLMTLLLKLVPPIVLNLISKVITILIINIVITICLSETCESVVSSKLLFSAYGYGMTLAFNTHQPSGSGTQRHLPTCAFGDGHTSRATLCKLSKHHTYPLFPHWLHSIAVKSTIKQGSKKKNNK